MIDDKDTPEGVDAGEPHFLDDQDVTNAFGRMLEEFSSETDRGAILIAADIVSAHLARTIEELAPLTFRAKRIKQLLNYPGVLSSFSARADIAYVAGFISETAHRSIDLLRNFRNKAAHSQDSFSLSERRGQLREMCDLGPGTATAVNRFALEAMMRSMIENLMAKGIDLEAQLGTNPFATPMEVVDHLRKHPDLNALVEERLPRMELAFGVWLLLGLIAHLRKSFSAARS
jgi:hypothetical protein